MISSNLFRDTRDYPESRIGGRSRMLPFLKRLSIAFASAFCFTATLISPVQSAPGLPFTESFDDTSLRDAVTTADWGITTLGSLTQPTVVPLTAPFGSASTSSVVSVPMDTRSIVLGDMDGDGDLDLVEGTGSGETSNVYLNDGTGTFGAGNALTGETQNARSIALGDMDYDGDLDIVIGAYGNNVRLLLNSGDGVTYSGQDLSTSTAETNSVAIADLNGDGHLDVVEGIGDDRANVLYLNTGDPLTPFGPFGSSGQNIHPDAQNTSTVLLGDIDSDGDVDIVVLNRDQKDRQYFNNGAASFNSNDIGTEKDNSSGGALGDMDGDGYLDLVVASFDAGEPSHIYFNNGASNPFGHGTQTEFTIVNDPDNANDIALADFDLDGTLDIVLVEADDTIPAAETNRIYLNTNGTGLGMTESDLGSGTDVTRSVAVGDVDGDGAPDVITGNNKRHASGAQENYLYLNPNAASGNPAVQQLASVAQSIRVDAEGSPISSVRMKATSTSVGSGSHNSIDYWVSSDGGSNWVLIRPGTTDYGRAVLLPVAGQDLRWRAVLDSATSANLSTMAVADVSLRLNPDTPSIGQHIGNRGVVEDTPITGIQAIMNDGSEVIFYSLSGLPEGTGISIDPINGVIEGTPTNEDASASPITLTVTGSDGAFTLTDTFILTVLNDNDDPTIDSTAVTEATQDILYSYTLTASDRDPDTPDLTFLVTPATTLPGWLGLVDNGVGDDTATLSGTPGPTDVGDHTVSIDVSDSVGGSATQTFTITVANVADAPSFTSTPVTAAAEDVAYNYNVTTTDPDVGDTLTITASAAPAWVTLTDNGDGTATLSGTPTEADAGDHAVTLEVEDLDALMSVQIFTITVANVNDAPTITSTAVTAATQGVAYIYAVTATDPDVGDTLTFTQTGLPTSLTMSTAGVITGTPGALDVGDHNISIEASDGTLGATQAFTLTVANVNDTPSFTSAAVTAAAEAVEYVYSITTQDLDADTVGITATTIPAWLTLTDNGDGTATLSGTPAGGDVGGHPVDLLVTDPSTASSMQSFTITASAAADAPVITITGANPASIVQNTAYTDQGATATDAQDGDLTGSMTVNNPVNTAVPGNYMVLYSVTDSAGHETQAQRSVTVTAPPPAPAPPPSSGGGGGSTGLVELMFLTLLGSIGAVGRRRRMEATRRPLAR